MAEASSVSDTQALLHSMLQRLKLQQTNNENGKHTQEVQQSPSTLDNHRIAETPTETPVFQFNGSLDTNHEGNALSTNSTPLDTPLTFHSPDLKDEVKPLFKQSDKKTGIFASPNPRSLRWGFLNNYSSSKGSYDLTPYTDDGEAPKWQWKQKLRKMSNSSSVSSLQSIDTTMPSSPNLDNQEQRYAANYGSMGQKSWTQKAKERWKDWHKGVEKREKGLKDDHVANSIHSLNLPQTLSNEIHTTSTALSEDTGIQHQPINSGPEESPLSSPDHLSEPIFSLGPINLMEEICTGPEWAKFLSPDINSHSQSSCNFQEQTMQTPSVIGQSSQQEHALLSQLDYKDPNFQSQMNSVGQYMDTTQCAFNQRNHFDSSLSPCTTLHQGQNNLFDSGSNHLESMDLSVSPSEINEPMKGQLDCFPYNQSVSTEWHAHQPLSSKQILNQSQDSELHQAQPENGHVEMLPVMDLSYVQSNDRASLKKELFLSRKRSLDPERRGSSERSNSEIGDIHELGHSATSENLNLSAASSSSSLQYSISQDSESSASPETVVKKRRVENTRRVRFAEEVIVLPPLILSDDEDDEDEDGDNDVSADNKDDEDCLEEPSPGPSVPRWIAALRNKTKRTPKLKIPHISSSRFRTRKKINFV